MSDREIYNINKDILQNYDLIILPICHQYYMSYSVHTPPPTHTHMLKYITDPSSNSLDHFSSNFRPLPIWKNIEWASLSVPSLFSIHHPCRGWHPLWHSLAEHPVTSMRSCQSSQSVTVLHQCPDVFHSVYTLLKITFWELECSLLGRMLAT